MALVVAASGLHRRPMSAPVSIPSELLDRPFTIDEAEASGVTRKMLRGGRFLRLFTGVYFVGPDEPTFTHWLAAALRVLPDDSIASHLTAMRLWGFTTRGAEEPYEFSTNTTLVTAQRRLRLHRRRGRLTPFERDALPVTGPDRTFVDCALRLSLVELVQLGDHLVHLGATTVETLTRYCHDRHIDGVQRARRIVRLVRAGAESPMETSVRLLLVFGRLPTPELNVEVHDTSGRFVARVDMLFRVYKVVVEYDGWQHERDARQRQRDRERREQLEALGYRLIVVTSEDLRHSAAIVWRVFHALKDRGYQGPEPVTSVTWRSWFIPEM